MTFVVKMDLAPDPSDITLFCGKGVVPASYGFTNLIPDEVVGGSFLGIFA